MRISSPLSDLSDVLSQIRESAIQKQATLRKNEAATRAVLIDPVLRALGWDTADPDMVEAEKTLDQARVDYALYDSNRTVRMIIEAKPLGTNLAQAGLIMSLVNYAFTFRLQDIFLTDGIIWQHFTNFQPGNVIVERTLDMASGDLVECAAYLVQRLDAAKFWPKKETIVIEPKPGNGTYVDLGQLSNITGKRPSHFRLPDGSEIAVKRWKDVLQESCKFALASNPKIPIPFLDHVGKKVSLFSNAKPRVGAYTTEDYNGQTIFIYVNYDAKNCVSNALHVLDKLVPKSSNRTTAAVKIADEQTDGGS